LEEIFMSQAKPQDDDMQDSSKMKIDVGHLSVTGHVIFAGRDASIAVNTGGDVAQTNTTTMTVGGVETNREQYDSMVNSIRNVSSTIESEPLVPEIREVAEYNLTTVENQLTAERKPNPQILIQALQALRALSPRIGDALLALFTEPLVGQIVKSVGGMLETFITGFGKPPAGTPAG
jgi:hypothetical protein